MNNQAFRQYLRKIHGKNVVANVLHHDRLQFLSSDVVWDYIMNYSRKNDDSNFCLKDLRINNKCPIPNNPKNPVSTDPSIINKRVIEFQNWAGILDLESNNEHTKEIMVLGESVIHDVSQYLIPAYRKRGNINLAYIPDDIVLNLSWGLNLNFSNSFELINKIAELDNNVPPGWALWIYLGRIFNNEWEYIVDNIYTTDIAHCNANKFNPTLDKCAELHLKTELTAINPKIIILLGYISLAPFLRQIYNLGFKCKPIEVTLENNYTYYKNFPTIIQAGTISINDNVIKFLEIPHPGKSETRYKHNMEFWSDLNKWFWDDFFQL